MKPVTTVKLLRQVPGTTLKTQSTTPSVVFDFNYPPSSSALGMKPHNQIHLPANSKSMENIPALMKLNEMMMNRNEGERDELFLEARVEI